MTDEAVTKKTTRQSEKPRTNFLIDFLRQSVQLAVLPGSIPVIEPGVK